jgi:hypothetical protein
MDELLIILNRFLSQTKLFIYKFYNKLCFLLNKQLTIQKMYAPLTESKNKTIEALSIKLRVLSKENSRIIKDSEKLANENKLLKDKITSMQELILKK